MGLLGGDYMHDKNDKVDYEKWLKMYQEVCECDLDEALELIIDDIIDSGRGSLTYHLQGYRDAHEKLKNN